MYIIFGKKICSACQEAKKTFEEDGIDYKYIDLDNMNLEEKATAAWYEALKEDIMLPYIINTDDDRKEKLS
ncbi:MAG: arsenate reductase family protein [Candidatus Thorarchaeota archaeon]